MAPPHGEVDFYSECTSAVEPKVVARSSSDSTADTTENGSPSISAPDSPLIESPPLVALAPFVAPDIKRRRVARSPGWSMCAGETKENDGRGGEVVMLTVLVPVLVPTLTGVARTRFLWNSCGFEERDEHSYS